MRSTDRLSWPGKSVQISSRQIHGTQAWHEPLALQETGSVEISGTALLSQEGSTIETAVEIVRGVVPKLYPYKVRLGTTPRGIRFAIPLPS